MNQRKDGKVYLIDNNQINLIIPIRQINLIEQMNKNISKVPIKLWSHQTSFKSPQRRIHTITRSTKHTTR